MLTRGTAAPVSYLGNWEIGACPEWVFCERFPVPPLWDFNIIRRHGVPRIVPIQNAGSTEGCRKRFRSCIQFLAFPCVHVHIFFSLGFGKFHTRKQCVLTNFWKIKKKAKIIKLMVPHTQKVYILDFLLINRNGWTAKDKPGSQSVSQSNISLN